MLITYKRAKVLKVKRVENINIYNEMSLVADKLRAIYTTFGWTHMLREYDQADELVHELSFKSLKSFQETKKDVSIASAGLRVDIHSEDDDVYIGYSFIIA